MNRPRIAGGGAAIVLAALFVLASAACGGGGGRTDATATRATGTAATASAAPAVTPNTSPAPPTAAGTTSTQPPATTTYTVQRGDTLFSIAQRFGVTVDAIAQANGITDPSRIEVGQVLIIPTSGVVPTAVPPSGSAVVISRGSTSDRVVTLTFDAGSDTGFAAQILDALAANGIVAAFGLTGRWAEENPGLVRRIVREGHVLINHSYEHPSFTGSSTGQAPLSQARRWLQLDQTEAAIQRIAGASTLPYFRAPYGDQDASVNADVFARGYRYDVLWTVDSQGWNGLSADQIVARCLAQAQPGAIYIFHVGSASQDANALQRVIDGLRADGYGFVSLTAFAPR